MNTRFPENYLPSLQENFLWESIPDGAILYEEPGGKLVVLNTAAEWVLCYCDGEHTVVEMFRDLELSGTMSSEAASKALDSLIEAGVVSAPGG
jgi:aminopeptidase-like protein